MSENKNIKVRYTKGYDSVESEEGRILIPIYGHAEYKTSGVKRFHDVLMTLMGVSGTARDLMDWLTAKMDNDNRVYNTVATRRAFSGFYREALPAHKPPTDSTINNSFARLKEVGLLLPMGRGCYMVNPKYYINSANEKSRPRLLRMILEFKDGEDTLIKVKR